jgi:hypothetical protein
VIREFVQTGDDQPDLFGAVGHLLVDPEVHEELGNAVSASEGDVWFLSITPAERCNGFAQLRIGAGGTAHIRYVYTTSESVRSPLIKAALAHAKMYNAKSVYTNDRKTNAIWTEFGFKSKPNKRGGNFVRWELVQ